MSSTPEEHRSQAPRVVRCAVITVSDTRTMENDRGGQEVVDQLQASGHQVVAREIIPDDPHPMTLLIERFRDQADLDVILLTGGTGVSSRDRTYETVHGLLTKELPGYGELFRMLSYQEIGAAAMLSRAVGGLAERTVVLTMPGSPAAVRLAMEKVILPEMNHLVREACR